jgi:transposase InsO family protein
MLKAKPAPEPPTAATSTARGVTAKAPNEVWHVDLTTAATSGGLWDAWLPLALPQCWPFCWWIAVVMDHFSRRLMRVAAFPKQPTGKAIRTFLDGAIQAAGTTPKHIICDEGFWRAGFKKWCQRSGICPRYGAVGKYGSIAVIERFMKMLKYEGISARPLPLHQRLFNRELLLFARWHNEFRPHMTLGGRTPDDVYHALAPANEQPRFEGRARWPPGSKCAAPESCAGRSSGLGPESRRELPGGSEAFAHGASDSRGVGTSHGTSLRLFSARDLVSAASEPPLPALHYPYNRPRQNRWTSTPSATNLLDQRTPPTFSRRFR